MKKVFFASFCSLAFLAACNQQPAQNADQKTADAPASEVAASAADTTFRAQTIELISSLYNDYVFGNGRFLDEDAQRFFTDAMADKLKKAYAEELADNGDAGYALWKFRTDAQESKEGDGLKEVRQSADNLYTAVVVDYGTKAVVDFLMANENGAYKINAVNVKVLKGE